MPTSWASLHLLADILLEQLQKLQNQKFDSTTLLFTKFISFITSQNTTTLLHIHSTSLLLTNLFSFFQSYKTSQVQPAKQQGLTSWTEWSYWIPLQETVSQPLLAHLNYSDLTIFHKTVNIYICSTLLFDTKILQGSVMTAKDGLIASIVVELSITSLKSIVFSLSIIYHFLAIYSLIWFISTFVLSSPLIQHLLFQTAHLWKAAAAIFLLSLFSNKTQKTFWYETEFIQLVQLLEVLSLDTLSL